MTRSVTETPWDGAAQLGMAVTSTAWRARRMVTGETDQTLWDGVRLAHNPEVAGSNPAPAAQKIAKRDAGTDGHAASVRGAMVTW